MARRLHDRKIIPKAMTAPLPPHDDGGANGEGRLFTAENTYRRLGLKNPFARIRKHSFVNPFKAS
jgi:hypothetical protein